MRYVFCLSLFNFVLGLGTNYHYHNDALDPHEFELELVQVLFRHGDRTPRKEEVYKNDPYKFVYPNIGYGELTNVGKIRMDRFGRHLRDLYGDFIGENGTDKIYAYYSGSSRTETSLRMALAGLLSKWSTFSGGHKYGLPLTLHNDSMELKFLVNGMRGMCSPRFMRMMEQNLNTSMWESRDKEFKDFDIDLVAKLTGAKPSPLAMVILYYDLNSVEHMGFPLPEWCSRVDCNSLKKVAKLFARSLTSNDWMKRITAGKILQRFMRNIGTSSRDQKKLHLYSAYDFQLITLVRALNLTDVPELLEYGSSITIEKVRKNSDGSIYIRMVMSTGEQPPHSTPLKLQGCDFNCPIQKFFETVRQLFPTYEDERCSGADFTAHNVASFKVAKN